jgi:hypothetical protein
MHPTTTAFDPSTEEAVQKAFFDHMWTIGLQEMVALFGAAEIPGADLSGIATKLNVGVAAHSAELRSYHAAYKAEVCGVADLMGEVAVEILNSMARRAGVHSGCCSLTERRDLENQCKNLLAIALVKNRARGALRTMHILASLHASFRWDKHRQFDGNDLYDFSHAAAALAYCDAFFTERPLCAMIKQPNIALNKLYDCHVVADVDDAIAYVRELVRI